MNECEVALTMPLPDRCPTCGSVRMLGWLGDRLDVVRRCLIHDRLPEGWTLTYADR